MKQKITTEQKKCLLSNDIMIFVERLQGNKVPQTIGELVEWIENNIKPNETIEMSYHPQGGNWYLGVGVWHEQFCGESYLEERIVLHKQKILIDGLFELCIKIKQEG